MAALKKRSWVPAECESHIQEMAGQTCNAASDAIESRIDTLIEANRTIHERVV